MEFTVFAAGIDHWRQVGQELGVEITTGEAAGQHSRIDAGDLGAETGRDHLPGKPVRRNLPDRKKGLQTGSGELFFAVGADVGKEEVPESHRLDPFGDGPGAEPAHSRFVLLVGTGPGERNDPKRQPGGGRLRFQKLAPDRVHGDAIEGFVYSGDEGDNFNRGILPQKVQRPGAILTARPGKRDALHATAATRS